MKRVLKIAIVAGALASFGLAAPAQGVVAVAVPGSFQTTYATPVTATRVGGPLVFVNADIQPHDVVAFEDFLPKKEAKKFDWCTKFPKGKCPIFRSELASTGGSAQVMGLENLESGSQYTFYCTVHPRMQGTLVAL